MSIKATVKKFLGKRGAEKLSLLKTQAQSTLNRTIRTIKTSNKKAQHAYYYKIDRYAVKHAHTFFGYYDVTPFSADNTKVLAMVTSSNNHGISTKADVTIGYFKYQDKCAFVPVGASSTWCWQMGCRLQWHPHDPNRLILYNTWSRGSMVPFCRTLLPTRSRNISIGRSTPLIPAAIGASASIFQGCIACGRVMGTEIFPMHLKVANAPMMTASGASISPAATVN
jgi:hypothetical protein